MALWRAKNCVPYPRRSAEIDFVEYDIWSLPGPRLVTAMLLESASFNRDVRWD